MRTVCFGLLFGLSLLGQAPREDPAVTRLAAALTNSRQLADAMMSLAADDRRPARGTVEKFADELTGVLAGRKLTDAQSIGLRTSLAAVMRGANSNYHSAKQFRDSLASLKLFPATEQSLTTKFIAIGEEVRGPDDAPVKEWAKD